MAEIIGKVWLLGGWFYLSLVLMVITYFLISKAFRQYLGVIVVVMAVATALVLSSKDLRNSQLNSFFKPIDEKIDTTTFNQYSFAKGVSQILPQGANGCIYWSSDLPTLYLQKELYPHRFGILQNGDSNQDCTYIISQFAKRDDPKFSLLYQYKDNYLYKMNLIQ